MKKILVAAAILGGCFAFNGAFAATTTGSLAVSATVSTVCSVSTTPLVFGEVSLTAPTNGQATISVTCTQGGTYDVGLDEGLNFSTKRRLVGGTSNFLTYELCQDGACSSPWGSTIGSDTVAGTGTGSEQVLTVFGQIDGGQTLVSGTGSLGYTDTVAVTVTY